MPLYLEKKSSKLACKYLETRALCRVRISCPLVSKLSKMREGRDGLL